MTGEAQIARSTLMWSGLIALPATLLALLVAGPTAALSIALAVAIILGNVALSAAFSSFGSRIGGRAPIMLSLPSLAVRMILSLAALQALKGQPFIDETVFVAAFCAALTVALVQTGRSWRRTPWLVQAFGSTNKEIA